MTLNAPSLIFGSSRRSGPLDAALAVAAISAE